MWRWFGRAEKETPSDNERRGRRAAARGVPRRQRRYTGTSPRRSTSRWTDGDRDEVTRYGDPFDW